MCRRRRTRLWPASVVAAVALGLLAPAPAGSGRARAIGASSQVRLSQLSLPGDGQPHRNGLAALVGVLRRRTNVNVAVEPKPLGLAAPELFRSPLLWTPARGALPALDAAQVARLRRHLARGGTWILDGPTEKAAQAAFLRSARALVGQVFPKQPLAPLPPDHTLFKSFYLLSPGLFARTAGPVLGLVRDRRAAVIVVHGVAAAAERDAEALAEEPLMRLAVNLVLYVLCVDYKSDQVHAPAILKRRQWKPSRGAGEP